MPREPRIYIENVLYFVIAKANDGRTLFSDVQDYSNFLELLSEYKREYGFKLFAFALLPDQLCLLVGLKNNVTISTIMHDLNSRYTKAYHSRYGTKGHLFKSRFKSFLVEKENYLLRLTRYIHTLPSKYKTNVKNKNYAYSSYAIYLASWHNRLNSLEMPAMYDEVNEVFTHLQESSVETDYGRAYEKYVNSADAREISSMKKLFHRTAFVGSKEFIDKMHDKVKEHIKEDEQARIIRRPNRVFVFTGSFVIIFLLFVAYNFYGGQTGLEKALNTTATSLELTRESFSDRVKSLQNEVAKLMENKYDGLNDAVWEIELFPVKGPGSHVPVIDRLSFKNGQLVSRRLEQQGFVASKYSTTVRENGEVVWQTVHVKPDGTKASWYGIWQNKKFRGILSERPAQGGGRDFSFVNISK